MNLAPTPRFHSSEEAIAFGRKMSAETALELKEERKRVLKCFMLANGQKRIDLAVQSQLLREAEEAHAEMLQTLHEWTY